MSIFSSPFLTPIRWLYGWEHRGKLTTIPPGYPTTAAADAMPIGMEGAFQIPTVWACIRLLSETTGTLPLILYRDRGEAGKERALDHPLYEILHDAPNADMTALEFWEGLVVCLCVDGNAYAEKKRINGRLISLEPMRSDATEVFRNSRGRRRYRYHGDPNRVRELDEDDVFHVRGFGNGGDTGLSPISYAAQTLYGARALQRTASKVAATGNRQQGVITMDGVLKPEHRDQVLKTIVQPFVDGKTLVLEAGMKFQPTTLTPEDAQMLESRKLSVEEICSWFRVPPFMVGHTEKSTSWGTGLEQQQIGFLTFALEPYLERIEQAVRRSLIAPEDRKLLSAEFLVEKLLRSDSAARAAFYSKALGAGGHRPWMSVNEVRAKENLPKVDGGDEMTSPLMAQAAEGPPE